MAGTERKSLKRPPTVQLAERSGGARSGTLTATALLLALATLAPVVRAQLPPVQPAPAWKQVPSGEGACSVAKSCAELAPDMIRSAMGDSPLAANVNTLARTIGPRVPDSAAAVNAAQWAAEAFRKAGADDVHFEKPPLTLGHGNEGGQSSSESLANVVAEIRGYEKPDEFVLIGAPLDSTASADESFAGACAVAALIDAVRVIHSSGSIPRRSIRFVLFTASEKGAESGQAYVRKHRAELDDLIAAVFFEPGAGPIRGYSLDGRGDDLAAVREALEPAATLGVKEFTVDAVMGGDSLDFLLEGVPTLVTRIAPQDASGEISGGELKPEVISELKRHAAIAAVTAYALADAQGPIAARQSREQVEQLLKNTGLDQQMKAAGLWAAWESGERGR